MKISIRAGTGSDNPIEFELVFKLMNDELASINESLELVCAGGYVMQLNGYRGTADIDAFFTSNPAIDSIIRKVGDCFNINKPDELWLNNSISNMNPVPPDDYCKVIHNYSNLIVKVVDMVYMIGMKLTSARVQDIKDVAQIVRNNAELQPFDLLSELIDMGLSVDISVLLDAFEGARGMEWLDKFYRENESELREYF